MALGALDAGSVLIIVAFIAVPVAGLAFALGAGKALKQVGKGQFAIDEDLPQTRAAQAAPVSKQVREQEIRQMLEARSYRRVARGGDPVDIDAELAKILGQEKAGTMLGRDKGLREEVRQLVIARNERRQRQGKKPVNVDREVERQLAELENLGQ